MGKPADSESLRPHFDEHWQLSLKNEPVVFEEGEEEVERSKAWSLVEMYLRLRSRRETRCSRSGELTLAV